MSNEQKADQEIHYRVTQELLNKVDQLSQKRGISRSEYARQALRAFINQEEDAIGSRSHFQKTFRERIDALEQKQTESLAAMAAQITQEFNLMHKALNLHSISPDELGNTDIAPSQMDSIILELHLIVDLLAFAFSKMLPRFLPNDPELADPNALFNNHVTSAQKSRNFYDTTLRLTQKLIEPDPFTDEDLLNDQS